MYKTKSDKTKEKLHVAMMQLISEKPLNSITVKELTERAGVNRQTFYYHYSCIDDMIERYCHLEIEQFIRKIRSDTTILQILRDLIKRLNETKESARILLLAKRRYMFVDLFHDECVNYLQKKVRESSSIENIDETTRNNTIEYCLLATWAILERWILGEINMSNENLARWLSESIAQQFIGMKTHSTLIAQRDSSNS